MKLLIAFFRLIRWPNLLFITITQCLFYYCIYVPLLQYFPTTTNQILFFMLVVASLFIAAAGYIINDYFDVQIDIINKPDRIVINKFIKRRWAIVWHLFLSAVGIVLSLYITFVTGEWLISFVNLLCVVFLLFYSTTFKRKLLSGNLIIAALTAWVILVVYIFGGAEVFSFQGWATETPNLNVRRLFKFMLLYASFAFIMTIIREAIKDLEDMEGDRKYNCTTMPIVWGVPAAKVFIAVWITVCIAALAILQLYAWQTGWWWAAIYILTLTIFPLALLLKKLYHATASDQYHYLSNMVKFIMLAGILSMLFVKYIR